MHFREENAIKTGVFKGFQCFKSGAGTRSRTKDFHITNVALYQLSYTGELSDIPADQVSIMSLPNLPRGTEQESVEVLIRVRNKKT